MHGMPFVFAVGILVASMSGCQLVETLLPDVSGQRSVDGICATYQVVASDERPVTPEILERTRTIIEDRANATGVSEPVVVIQGSDRISVALPGIEDEADIRSVRSLIGTTGVIEFTPVPTSCAPLVEQGARQPRCLDDTAPLFDGTGISAARVSQDETTGETVIDLELEDAAARIFDGYAAEHLGEQFAIVLDGIVESAPSINATHFGGQAQISGTFSVAAATDLVTVLEFGPLPLGIREVDFGTCQGPTR
jgi:preprotein translocase subunit SecD